MELDVGDDRKTEGAKVKYIRFVSLFPLSTTLLVWSMYGEGPELLVLVENAIPVERMRDSQASTTSI